MASRIFRSPALGRIRFAQTEDAPKVMEMIGDPIAKTFRIEKLDDIVCLIEQATLAVTQFDVNETLVGFLALKDYPLIPAVHSCCWENYIWNKYKTVGLNSRNTLFIHLICWNTLYSRDIVDNMLKSVFMHDPYVQHIVLVKTLIEYPQLVPGQSRSEASFRRVQVMERGASSESLPSICIADRREVSPRLKVRRAVEEDNDDIVPIIDQHSKRLRELYGEFYVSELVSRHPESERVLLVCEHKELAVGVMGLNTQINFEALEECYDLSPFGGLRRIAGKPTLKGLKVVTSAGNLTNSSQYTLQINEPSATSYTETAKIKDGRMGRISEASTELDLNWAQLRLTHVDVLNLLDDDEDEIEYDIVNIDNELLRLPEILSYEAVDEAQYLNGDSIEKSAERESFTSDRLKDHKKSIAAPRGNTMSFTVPEVIRYQGASNAFLLELFAMQKDYDERYGFDLLEAAFELFPDRDYCILCLPSSHTAFPLLEHFTLVAPLSSRLRFINETLYVAHVNSVRGNVSVRPAEPYDMPAVNEILENVARRSTLLDLFSRSLKPGNLSPYVLLSEEQPIGVVVVGPLEDSTIRVLYDLEPEPMLPCSDGAILSGVMSPVLEPHMRWYMRDILRQSEYKTLFWLCRLINRIDGNTVALGGRNLMSFLSRMMPVPPRRNVPNLSGDKRIRKLFIENISSPFALWMVEKPLTCLPKVDVNSKIVVVGASLTALAFLDNLLMGPSSQYLTFSNVTLVSERGLCIPADSMRSAEICVPRTVTHVDRCLKTKPFYAYVDVCTAVMVGIDRKNKFIRFKDGGVIYYDVLVLVCGLQFQHPYYMRTSLEDEPKLNKDACNRLSMDNPNYRPDKVPPPPKPIENVLIINCLHEANLILRQFKRMMSETQNTQRSLCPDNPVVVYGECVEVYCCMAALLELGVQAESIVFVEHFPEDDVAMRVNCFNNETVDQRVQAGLSEIGIRTYRQCSLIGFRYYTQCIISALKLMGPMHVFMLPCFALFYYGIKAININTFKAINESGLVYDGGLVVGPTFDTNDPNIYAAGTGVTYSRKLYSTYKLHKYYTSEDIGRALASLFLRKFDPFVMGDPRIDACPSDILPRYNSGFLPAMGSHPSIPRSSRVSFGPSRRWQPVKTFESPIVIAATLPGPLYYMKVRKPGPDIPMEVQLSLPHQGHTLKTDKKGNYFRLQLNELHYIESYTLLSHEPFSVELMAQIHGIHEIFFDNLLKRYLMNKIDDFYEFFTQTWLSAPYQETYDKVIDNIMDYQYSTVHDVVDPKCYNFSLDISTCKSVCDMKEILQNLNSEGNAAFGTPTEVPSCIFGRNEADNLGTIGSILEKYVLQDTDANLFDDSGKVDIPSECGQNDLLIHEAAAYWNAVGGGRLMLSQIMQYLRKFNLTNPHYALPKPDLC